MPTSCCQARSASAREGKPTAAIGLIVGRAVLTLAALPRAETVSVAFRKSGMLAVDGRCKTLDAAADGYVRAEAVGSALLELLPAYAQRQSQVAAFAVLVGSAVNQDGRSSGLTAPNGPAQQEVLRATLGMAGIQAAAVSAVELHGTGTSLGDPIELGALAAVHVKPAASTSRPLVLMAGKSLIGHSEPAAGMMGLAHAQAAVALGAALPLLHLQTGEPGQTLQPCFPVPPLPVSSMLPDSSWPALAAPALQPPLPPVLPMQPIPTSCQCCSRARADGAFHASQAPCLAPQR